MASQINKYAQNIARARYATPSYTGPQRRATIDPSLFTGKGKGKTAASGAPLASREVPAPIQETGPEAMSVTDGEASTKPQMVTETQQPIENRGASARYMIQGGGPRIDLSFLVPERANPNFDPSKAIGGENVPYQESKGIGGFFRRMLGDESNRMNIEAQQAQGAEWKAEKAEALKEERLLKRMAEADKPTQARFEAAAAARKGELEAERETRAAEREQDRADRLKRETAEEARRLRERQEDMDRWRQEHALRTTIANEPRFGAFGTDKGGMTIFNQRTGEPSLSYTPEKLGTVTDPKTGKQMPGMVPGGWEEYKPLGKIPDGLGGAPVNRNDGSVQGAGGAADTMGGPVPLGPENQNTALLPRFGRVLGSALSEAGSAVTDPLRVMGTEAYKSLLSSGAQQDPEVLKRIKAREARMANYPEFDFSAPTF